jgi:hypothetical protein
MRSRTDSVAGRRLGYRSPATGRLLQHGIFHLIFFGCHTLFKCPIFKFEPFLDLALFPDTRFSGLNGVQADNELSLTHMLLFLYEYLQFYQFYYQRYSASAQPCATSIAPAPSSNTLLFLDVHPKTQAVFRFKRKRIGLR